VVLNGHTDVVPVDGQAWTSDPFQLTRRDGRLYGRGTTDMKGFLACMLAAVPMFQAHDLKLAGASDLLLRRGDRRLRGAPPGGPDRRARVAAGRRHRRRADRIPHRVRPQGRLRDAHRDRRAVGPRVRSAQRGQRHLLCRALRRQARGNVGQLAIEARENSPFDPPYSTINVGTFHGGTARNVIAGHCVIDWELRPIPGEDGRAILAEIDRFAREELLPEMRALAPQASIFTTEHAAVPALDPADAVEAVALISEITGLNSTECVSFGTDAGHFCHGGISTAVFGPGSIKRAHRPDEFIEERELPPAWPSSTTWPIGLPADLRLR
jgi:acetylornithine deacetylase